jgi:hypothetical protein
MERSGQMLFWTIVGSLATVLTLIIGLKGCGSSPSPVSQPSSPATAPSTTPTSVGSVPGTSVSASAPSTRYFTDMAPGGDLSNTVTTGLVQIYGHTYPKSIDFYCGTSPGDTPGTYNLNGTATKFMATVGLEDKWPTTYVVGMSVVGDGRTLKTFSVSVLKPRKISVDVTNVQILQLECSDAVDTSDGVTYPADVAWGNARVVERV